MIEKKLYIWRLGTFLHAHKMHMSAQELATHLNRNRFRTEYGSEFEGLRGTYTLIRATWQWVTNEFGEVEATGIALAFVKPDGTHAWGERDAIAEASS
jgi:hypothetical protein